MIMAGIDADRRRVEADEQEMVAKGRQVGQRGSADAVDVDGGAVFPGPGPVGERRELVRRHRRSGKQRTDLLAEEPQGLTLDARVEAREVRARDELSARA